MSELKSQITAIDHQLSKRPIALDPAGYFIIYLDREAGLICAKHYSNIINEKGLVLNIDDTFNTLASLFSGSSCS